MSSADGCLRPRPSEDIVKREWDRVDREGSEVWENAIATLSQ
jgi:hypothetical protein